MATDIGLVRTQNEDCVALARMRDPSGRPYLLAAVCDGMGGMADGAVCSSLGMAAFFSAFFHHTNTGLRANESLAYSALDANRAVFQRYRGTGGTTLSAVLITPENVAFTLNVGDSRIFHISEDSLTQLTKDDTIAGQLEGRDPNFHGSADLLQFVGVGPGLEPHITQLLLLPSSKLLITSDGVHYLPTELLARVGGNAPDDGVYIRRLIELSKWCGGHDNASALVLSPSDVGVSVSGGSDLVEIWDSFGELQLILPTSPSDERKDSPPEVLATGNGAASEGQSIHPKVLSPHRKGSKKKKQEQANKKVEPSDRDDGEISLPQLKIEFPDKR